MPGSGNGGGLFAGLRRGPSKWLSGMDEDQRLKLAMVAGAIGGKMDLADMARMKASHEEMKANRAKAEREASDKAARAEAAAGMRRALVEPEQFGDLPKVGPGGETDPYSKLTLAQRYAAAQADYVGAGGEGKPLDPEKLLPRNFDFEGDAYTQDPLTGAAHRTHNNDRPTTLKPDEEMVGEDGRIIHRAAPADYTLGEGQTRYGPDNKPVAQGYIAPKVQSWDPENNAVVTDGMAPQGFDDLWSRLERRESGGRQNAVSNKGAFGVAQLMPDTAAYMAGKMGDPGLADRARTDPAVNRTLGQAYLKEQLEKYGSHTLALAAYNAGPAAVDRWLNRMGDPRKGEISEAEFASRIPFGETRSYVSAILGRGASGAKPSSRMIAAAPKPVEPEKGPPPGWTPAENGFFRNRFGQVGAFNSRGTFDVVSGPTPVDVRNTQQSVGQLNGAMRSLYAVNGAFRNVGQLGPLARFGPKSKEFAVLDATVKDLQIRMKEVYGLGALTAPDMAFIEGIANDPNKLMSEVQRKTFGARLNAIADALGRQYGTTRETWAALGGDPAALPPIARAPKPKGEGAPGGRDGTGPAAAAPGRGSPMSKMTDAELARIARGGR